MSLFDDYPIGSLWAIDPRTDYFKSNWSFNCIVILEYKPPYIKMSGIPIQESVIILTMTGEKVPMYELEMKYFYPPRGKQK